MFGGRKETAGSIVRKARIKQASEKAPHVIELADEMTKDIMPSVTARMEKDKHLYKGDFYLELLIILNKILKVPHCKYQTKWDCPSPDYDQSVFKYNYKSGSVDYLWTIPSKAACFFMLSQKKNIKPESYESLSYVIKFQDGTLDNLAKKLNGEKLDGNIIGSKEWKMKPFQGTSLTTLKEEVKPKEARIILAK